MGSGNERTNNRLEQFRAWLVEQAKAHPVPPEFKPKSRRRWSGPTLVPSDWWSDAGQLAVTPQCNLCHERPLPGSPPLVRGLCGVCRVRLAETPEAA